MPKKADTKQATKSTGLSAIQLSRHRKSGVIPQDCYEKQGGRYYYDLPKLKEALKKNLSVGNAGSRGKKRQPNGKYSKSKAKKESDDDMSLNEARRQKEVALAKIRQNELAEQEARLCDVAGVEKAFFDIGRACSDGLNNLKFRLAPVLQGKTDVFEIQEIIGQETDNIIDDIVEMIDAAKKRR